MHLPFAKRFPVVMLAAVLLASAAPPASGEEQPESASPLQAIDPLVSDIQIRIPVGLHAKAPPGADLEQLKPDVEEKVPDISHLSISPLK